ncbi:N-acetylmuramoyl-L-alanine amidase [Peptoniphilus obesi]|uniref:N-acetylmuramoyl-L-alanine amidase n=1 Tax=Peptoniphilus obesi TaxID=1472765 RepID=UPI0004B76420|nr:N-acetylmuramoyl-L-alanine amidase [Peptoniphilus obesi]
MKKIILFFLFVFLLVPQSVAASSTFNVKINNKNTKVNDVNINIDGKILKTDFKAYNVNGRTFIPIREVTENLGATVSWDNKLKSATVNYGDKNLVLQINSNVVYLNGKKQKIDKNSVPRFANYSQPRKESKTMVPIRFISETLGYDVDWDQKTSTVFIKTIKGDKIDAEEKELIKDSKPVKESYGNKNNEFISKNEKKEMNKIEKKSDKEIYKAAGLDVDDIKKERKITKTIKAKGKVSILIDPGHGGKDPGASAASGLQEKEITLELSRLLRDKFANDDLEIEMTRDKDEYVKLLDRAGQANEEDFEIFVSIHVNSSDNRDASGIEVLYASEKNVEIKEAEQKLLAKEILDAIIKETGAKSRGVKNRPDLIVLNKTKCVSALVEVGFLSNPQEYDKLTEDQYLDSLATGIYKGVKSYIDKYVE